MLSGAALSGYNLNQIELSPNYAGTLRGASSTIANICGFATPAVVGALTNGQVSISQKSNIMDYMREHPHMTSDFRVGR